jgi:trans-aconitate methyltransferase/transcription elongation factor Elf1
MSQVNCPVCNSENLKSIYPSYTGPCITSDMEILPDGSINNNICKNCGLIFNASGTRGKTEEFYRDCYSLMTKSESAGIQSFSGSQPKSQAERTYDFLVSFLDPGVSGSILEAGAGKGEFLQHFVKDFPNWNVEAFEPSHSFDYLVKALPQVSSTRCDYSEYVGKNDKYDLIVSLGVLEHVENPLEMLIWINERLPLNGHFFLRVPNFIKNPNDLFAADHLSKLTIHSIETLAKAAGFAVVKTDESGVPVFALLRKLTDPSNVLDTAYDVNLAIAIQNEKIAKGIVESVLECRYQARLKNEKFAVFGMASAGLFAPFLGSFDPNEITAYIDENRTIWGGTVHGRPIGGLALIRELSIKHIALSVSPVYFDQIKAKLAPLGISIYAA